MTITLENSKEHNLTTIERKAIKAVLEAGLTAGKVGRKEYRLKALGMNRHEVNIRWNEFDACFNRPVVKSHTVAITVS
jgi:hypothetical protein